MKKIFGVFTAAVLLSICGSAQEYLSPVTTYYMKSNVILERNSNVQMNIIGNPAKDVVVLQISDPNTTQYELTLYSSTGRKVSTILYDHPAGVSTKIINVSQLQRGMYFLVAWNNNLKRSLRVILQ